MTKKLIIACLKILNFNTPFNQAQFHGSVKTHNLQRFNMWDLKKQNH